MRSWPRFAMRTGAPAGAKSPFFPDTRMKRSKAGCSFAMPMGAPFWVDGRARLRIDANQGYSRSDGCRFASALDPEVVDWFEQPCALRDWDSNAAVAKVSAVPVMLDESIYSFVDIQRAAGIEGVGFIKH